MIVVTLRERVLKYRNGIDSRSGRAAYVEWCEDEQERPALLRGSLPCKLLEVQILYQRHPHRNQGKHVHR